MIEIENQTDLEIHLDTIEPIARALTKRPIELLVVDSETIKKLNKEHRGIDSPTDVLSFPLQETPGAPLGSIVICASKVREGAKKFGHSEAEEFALLFIHGLLHLLGYDHETDEGQMRAKEAQIIEHFHLPQSLIVRNE